MNKTYDIGGKKFVLDETKAVQAYQEKMVINGRETMTFNLLPLKVSVGIRFISQDEV